MGRARWILALAALALLLLYALQGGERSAPPASVLPTSPGVLRAPVEEELLATETMEPPLAAPIEGPREEIAAAAELVLEPPTPDEPVGEIRELSGRVTVLDPEGEPVPHARGTFFLAFVAGKRVHTRQMTFAEGKWSRVLEVGRDWTSFTVRVPVTDAGEVRLVEPRGEVDFPFVEPFHLVLRLRPAAFLRVVDLESGRELDEVCVASAQGWRSQRDSAGLLAGGPDCEGERESSPIALDGRFSAGVSLVVGAPGYAWQSVRFDFLSGGTRSVFLSRGAELTVEVSCRDVDPQPLLKLYRIGAPSPGIFISPVRADLPGGGSLRLAANQLFEGPIGQGLFAFADLQPGSYRATLEYDQGGSPTDVLAEEKLELVAGLHTRLRLTCSPPPTLATAPAAGILRVPAAWGVERLSFVLVALGSRGAMRERSVSVEAHATHAGGQDFAWSVEDLAVGEHLLEVHQVPFSAQLELPHGGQDDFFHELPPPCELRVRVLDAAGEAQRDPVLTWMPMGGAFHGMQISRDAEWDAEQRCWRILAPVGSIRLSLRSSEHPIVQKLELQAGFQEHEIQLRSSSGIRLRLMEGLAPVELPRAFKIRLQGPGGLSETVGSDGFERLIHVPQPGTYRLDIPKLPGYHAPAPEMIEIQEGRIRECVIELQLEHP